MTTQSKILGNCEAYYFQFHPASDDDCVTQCLPNCVTCCYYSEIIEMLHDWPPVTGTSDLEHGRSATNNSPLFKLRVTSLLRII